MAKFTDIFLDVTRDGHKIPKENYLFQGKYPIIDQGQEYIAGYSDESEGLYKNIPVIIFGDHTRIIKYIDQPFFPGADGVKLLKAKDPNANYKYLYYALSYLKIPNTGYNRHFKWLKEADIKLPSQKKQQHIVEVLDKLSNLISLRKQQLAILDELVKARFVEMFGDPVSNSKYWNMCMLGERCKIITGNTPPRTEPGNYGTFIEWIKSDNINTPHTYLTTAQEYLSKKGFEKSKYVDKGSLLMTCIAGSINCIGNIAISDRMVAFNQQINAIIPYDDDILYLYWMVFLSKPVIQNKVNNSLKGILSKAKLSTMKFPFPPHEIQAQFSSFCSKVEKQKLIIQRSFDRLEVLRKSLMQEYFR